MLTRFSRTRAARPSYYPTPYDRRQAFKRAVLTVTCLAVFAGLGVLLAWRM